jgi:RNA polymerase sigma factor for flagellar operon FliA
MTAIPEPATLTYGRNRKPAPTTRRRNYVDPGSSAESELVERYLPLVKTVVGRVAINLPSHVNLDDLNSAGLVGLLNAVRNYDPEGGSSFESYARVRIRGAVLDELRRLDWVPRSVHDKARRVQSAIQELEQKIGQVPTPAQVARALELTPREYEELLEEIRPATFVCLDAAPGPDGESDSDSSRYDTVADESQENPVDVTARRELSRMIADRINHLPEMQRRVLALYYFEDLRLREIAEVFGVTESRICQIHSQAVLTIRAYVENLECDDAA